jgi:hypothetical protein
MKRAVWTALAAGVTAGAAMLALRALRYVWRRVTHEEPPDESRWAKWLVAAPLKKGIERSGRRA